MAASTDRRFAALRVWERVGDRLPWYLAVSKNERPAKHLIARRIGCSLPPDGAPEADLWDEHTRRTPEFLALWRDVRDGRARLSDVEPAAPSLVDLSAELAGRMLAHCTFCRWNCRVDRTAGARHGTCQLESASRVGSYFHHRGEELVFRGTQGSGTIFFTSCNMRCQFCQNGDISHDKDNGVPFSAVELAAAARQLRLEGCHNINFVGGEPTIHLHTILGAVRELAAGRRPPPEADRNAEQAKADRFRPYAERADHGSYAGELNAPLLWNSNFFMTDETTRLLRCLFDVWLPDFKFGPGRCAVELARTPWYFETVTRNLKAVYGWGEDMVIRHLVMPGHVECCTKPVLDWVAAEAPEALVNVMDQYHPDYACDPGSAAFNPRFAPLARRPTSQEVLDAYAHARRLGLRFEEVSLEKQTLGLLPGS
ncbi:MAG TPA: radical SAM protein [Candidatus Thermoplasmatota archaeon]